MKIDGETRIFLLLGRPVSHSLSPLLYNAAFEALDLNCAYLAAEVAPEALPAALSAFKALNIGGGNITAPYKEDVLPFLDHISPAAQAICSVNTIVNREGILWGDTTDGAGFIRALTETAPENLFEDPFLIVGAGGAARAVAYSLSRTSPVTLYIANRSSERAKKLAALLSNQAGLKSCRVLPLQQIELQSAIKSCRTVIYCLPDDSADLEKAFESAALSGRYFFDLRYYPQETGLMRVFRKYGGNAWNGKKMLLWQAALAFEHFTGLKAPLNQMRRAIGD